MKSNFSKILLLSSATLLVACGGDSGNSSDTVESSSSANENVYESIEELPNCVAERESESVFVTQDEMNYVCLSEKWDAFDYVENSKADLPNCTKKKDGEKAFVSGEILECSNEKWNVVEMEPSYSSSSSVILSSSSEESSSSVANSSSNVESSSSNEIPGLAGNDEKSSSSSVVESSSSGESVSSSSALNTSSSSALNTSSSSDEPVLDPDRGTEDLSSSSITYGTLNDPRDNQTYKTVTIGTQTWMAENLNYNYNEGTAKSYCYIDRADSCTKYGRLYLWSAAMDSAAVFSAAGKGCGFGQTCSLSETVRGVCPEGWHLPSDDEWNTLFTTVGGTKIAGMWLMSTSGWNGGGGTDSFGFAILPAGYRYGSGDFSLAGYYAYFWSSTEDGSLGAYTWSFCSSDVRATHLSYGKHHGVSVRCLRD